MSTLTPAALAEIRQRRFALLDHIGSGAWQVETDAGGDLWLAIPGQHRILLAFRVDAEKPEVQALVDFLSHASTDVPQLLAEVDRLTQLCRWNDTVYRRHLAAWEDVAAHFHARAQTAEQRLAALAAPAPRNGSGPRLYASLEDHSLDQPAPDPYIGQRGHTSHPDWENDDEHGEVLHPVGSEYEVARRLDDPPNAHAQYMIRWLGKAIRVQDWLNVPAAGMWTCRDVAELQQDGVTQAAPTAPLPAYSSGGKLNGNTCQTCAQRYPDHAHAGWGWCMLRALASVAPTGYCALHSAELAVHAEQEQCQP